jgi:2-dehydro-3-deoxygluconokinase
VTATPGNSQHPVDVVTFGETMAALRSGEPLRLGGSLRLSVAGAEANVAIGLARLGHATKWVGRVGDDELGALILRTMRAEGVDSADVRLDAERPTGLFLLERRLPEVIRVRYYRNGSAGGALTAADVAGALVPGVRMLHLTGITPALSASAAEAVRFAAERARGIGLSVSFDVNYRARLWPPATARETLRPLAVRADVLFASDSELALLTTDPDADSEATATALLGEGVGAVVVKRGRHGAVAYTRDGVSSVPARSVPVADAVGAGDAFVAGYLSAALDGLDVTRRLSRGATVSAFAVASAGDWEGLPTRAELDLLDSAGGATIR